MQAAEKIFEGQFDSVTDETDADGDVNMSYSAASGSKRPHRPLVRRCNFSLH